MKRGNDDDIRRLKSDRAALLELCDAQRRKIEKQADEIARLRTRIERMQSVINELVVTTADDAM